MADMGLGPAFGAAAASDALQNIKQQVIDRAMRQRQLDLEQQRIDLASQGRQDAINERRQRDADAAESRREGLFYKNLALRPAGSPVTPPEQGDFTHFNAQGLLEPRPLDTSAGSVGYLTLPGQLASPSPDDQASGVTPITGRLMKIGAQTAPGNPGDMLFRGTASDLNAQDRIDAQRSIAQARADAQAARDSATQAYRDRAADARDYANSLRERDINRRDDYYNLRANPPDDPALPRGVQDYMAQLRSRYGNDLQGAETEFTSALPDLRSAHPGLDTVRAISGLRSMFGAAPGASKTGQILQDFGISGAANGGSPPPRMGSIVAKPNQIGTGNTITRAELRAVAQRLNVSEQQAAQQAQARGLQIVEP